MSDLKNTGVKIALDIEREMVFSLNVLDACIEKYGKMDDVLNTVSSDMKETVWLAVQMLNEGAEIYNYDHPSEKIPLLDEIKLKRHVSGLGGIIELQKKVRDAMLKGLPQEAVEQVEEIGKNLMAAQSQKMNRQQKRHNPK